MRVVITGGAGFVGAAVVRHLRGRGHDVVALVREPGRAGHLAGLGVALVASDLSDVDRLAAALDGADGVIYAAGSYRVGIRASERAAMWDANVGTTTRVLEAAAAAGTARIAYVSTGNVYGNTHHRVVDELYRRDLDEGFLSWYDEMKYRAHVVAEEQIAAGAPVIVVLPSQVYGPGDHTAVGKQLRLAHAGRLRYRALDDVGLCFVHADDLAAGIVAALDRGRIGQAYNLAGPAATLREAIALVARLAGHRPPSIAVPTGLLRGMATLGRLVGQPNLGEVVDASAGVTYWFSAAKAAAELGFAARDLEEGFGDTFRTD